ncbi:guanylate cyclase 32E isoform X2 [Bacillus rossius redtenbacheri]|uniref:guanylate cyclase 32E isoform X2 n=1 Tax=Bacillus rossius redtenbacheri TaxID=93214 RepID=UPI002FDC9CB8
MWPLLLVAPVFTALLDAALCENFVLGYLTGSRRRPGDHEYSRPGLTISGAISLAVREANQGELAARGHSLSFAVAETCGEELASVRHTAALWAANVSAYIGPQETCVHEARMAAAFNLPMISYFCTHHATSDKRLYPTFARTRPAETQISKSVVSVLLAFNWTQVALFYLNTDEMDKVALTIASVMERSGVAVRFRRWWSKPYIHGYEENPFVQMVEDTFRDVRVYVVIGYYYEHVGLMVAMEEKNLFDKGEYWVVGVDVEQYDQADPAKYLRGLLHRRATPGAGKAFRNYLGVAATPQAGFDNFTELVNHYMQLPPFNYPNPLDHIGRSKKIRAEAAYLYDAVLLYAAALVEVLDSGGDPRDGSALVARVRGRNYRSVMGYLVYMDENGDAEGNYTLLARQPHHFLAEEYGLYPVGTFARPGDRSLLPALRLTGVIDWPVGRPPVAEPRCGFRGEKCITHTAEIAAGVAGAVLLALAAALLVLYRNWRYEQELDSLLWKVDYRDIQVSDEHAASLGSKISRATHPLIRTSQVSLSSNPDAEFRYSTIYTNIGIYKGRVLAIKKVPKKSVDITRAMKKELKMMRDLRHDNLNAFIGACTDPPNICIVTEYCTRGSLKDILENEDVKLDNMFVASLVGDIIRGMLYLHDSPVRFHGSLKTSNCLVDSRWVVKLADFGLHEFKRADGAEAAAALLADQDSSDAAGKCEGLLYRAPELLRAAMLEPPAGATTPAPVDARGSQKGDVYSFGVILYELHARHGPFGEQGLSPAEVLHRVMNPRPGEEPFRPPLELLENSFDFVRDCLLECWAEDPDSRPDFKAVRTKLRPLRKGMKPNIFDNMMAMMEKYANNLEALVDERTDQLQEEKKKTDALLYEMLPRCVAEQLKKGNKVEAESFDCVTIYFSDIVGFTAMSAESTPLQVVDFLNDLYTCFDSIIENYDVYKVETIGDAYMVVSGLPARNGSQHAGEVASMSLHLLEAIKRFRIRHRPRDNLMLRIGIHSGPVCAGVVGLKMPRYCLFGDTVNTASRMESTGSALRIHCSSECAALLRRLGGYQLAERGLVPLKGKGDRLTYWLQGEEAGWRARRAEQRALRRAAAEGRPSRQQRDSNGYPCRSSLKAKGGGGGGPPARSPLGRCASLESPKRLRFASATRCSHDPLLEAIADNSPRKSLSGQLDAPPPPPPGGLEAGAAAAAAAMRKNSSSCPCMEHLAAPADGLAAPLSAPGSPVPRAARGDGIDDEDAGAPLLAEGAETPV